MASPKSYTRPQIALHWAIALLVLGNYILSEGMPWQFDRMLGGKPYGGTVQTFHVYAGLAVLALALIRLVLRVRQGAPEASDRTPALAARAGRWGHRLLYVLMIAVPALGALAWYGRIEPAGDIHVLAMNALMILAGIHALAALYHQFVIRDGLLTRMTSGG